VASHEPEGYLEKYQRSFADLGVTDVVELYIDDRVEAVQPEKLRAVQEVNAIFFSGGISCGSPVKSAILPSSTRPRHLSLRGVIAGTSAGASAMSETMLVKGRNSASFRIGDLHMAPGLGLIPNVIIDQHFAERGRIGRLLGAVAQNPRVLGIGIDEDTAIVVQDSRFRVIGCGAVYVVDGSSVTRSNIAEAKSEDALSICDLRLHVLSSGDAFDLSTRRPEESPQTMADAEDEEARVVRLEGRRSKADNRATQNS
jgi:cyanophycinase